MNAIAPAQLAIHHTRTLLIKAGLTEVEADRFLERLSREFTSGSLKTDVEQVRFIERELARLEELQHRAPQGSGTVRAAVIGIVSSLAANVIYDVGKSVLVPGCPTVPSPPVVPAEASEKIIRIEWAGAKLNYLISKNVFTDPVDRALQHALQLHEQNHGTLDPMTAVYLDGMAMFLDQDGSHRRAERLRRHALKISQKFNGPDHESTAAALSNLGVCLFAQRKYPESEQCLSKAFRILAARYGTNHILTAAAIYNIYYCLNGQGRLLSVRLPDEFKRGLPQLRQLADVMLATKGLLLLLIALRDNLRGLSIALGAG